METELLSLECYKQIFWCMHDAITLQNLLGDQIFRLFLNKIQRHKKDSKERFLYYDIHNLQIFRVIPFVKQQNNKQQLNG